MLFGMGQRVSTRVPVSSLFIIETTLEIIYIKLATIIVYNLLLLQKQLLYYNKKTYFDFK